MFKRNWSEITTDPKIMSWINGYSIRFSHPVSQKVAPIEKDWLSKEFDLITERMLNLKAIGAIT